MKRLVHFLVGILSTATMVAASVVPAAAAGSASLSLSPSSSAVKQGETLTLTINVSAADQINVVQADLTYDSSKLEFSSVDASGSGFDFAVAASGGSGTVQVVRGVSGGGTVTGSKKLASVRFKALAGSGSTAVSFASSSSIIRPSDNENVWNGATSGGTYSFEPAPAPTSSGGGGGSSQQPSNTSKPASSVANAEQNPSPDNPQPAADDEPVPTTAEVEEEKGYLVAVQVYALDGTPARDVEVVMDDNVTVTTDDKGVASFVNVAAGEHTVTSLGGQQNINVLAAENRNAVQTFGLFAKKSADASDSTLVKALFIGLGTALFLAVLLGGAYVIMRGRLPFGFFTKNTKPGAGVTTATMQTPGRQDHLTQQEHIVKPADKGPDEPGSQI